LPGPDAGTGEGFSGGGVVLHYKGTDIPLGKTQIEGVGLIE